MDLLIKGMKYFFFSLLIMTGSILISIESAFSQESVTADDKKSILNDFAFAEEEIDFYALEESLNVRVDIASLFKEDEIFVGSSVSSITPGQWKILGARRYHEALNNEISVISYPNMFGVYDIAIRGYAGVNSDKGTAILVDGVPCNEMSTGSALYVVPNFELGVLDKIEMIKGPGSAIYGSDAFHGVIAMKTFESDRDHYSIEVSGAYPEYGDGNVRISHGFGDNLLRFDIAASASGQGDQNIKYEWVDENENLSGKGKYNNEYKSCTGIFKVRLMPDKKLSFSAGAYYAYAEHNGYPGPYTLTDPTTVLKGEEKTIYLRNYDYSNAASQFIMGKGEVLYRFYNDISVEASGFYWRNNPTSKVPFYYSDTDYMEGEHVYYRYGSSLVIKQPDNPLNLQWLIAFSHHKMKIVKSISDLTVKEAFGFPDQRTLHFVENVQGSSRNINSIFGHFKYGLINKRLYLLGGGRLDAYSDFGYQVSPRGGGILLPSENSVVKALWGRSFRAPSPVEQEGKDYYAKGNEDISPETIDIFELIYMYKTKRVKVTLSGFYSYWQNGIIMESMAVPVDSNKYEFANEGKNHSYGGEFSLYYNMNPFGIDLSFAYVESYALDMEDPADPSRSIDQKYNAFPTYSLIAGLYYNLSPYNINFFLNNRLYLEMKEAPESQNPDAGDLPPYYRLDLNISKIVSGRLEIFLDLRNLLNRKNYLPSIWGVENGYLEQGFSVMLRAGYRF